MTFKYSVTLSVGGGNKLRRFKEWAELNVPSMSYSLPVQTPIKTETMTVKLLSLDDRKRLLEAFAGSAKL